MKDGAPSVSVPDPDEWYVQAYGLPRPLWAESEVWWASIPEEAKDEAAKWMGINWLRRLSKALPRNYRIGSSPHFLLLAPDGEVDFKQRLRFLEEARAGIKKMLGEAAHKLGWGPHVVIHLASMAEYDAYCGYFISPTETCPEEPGIGLEIESIFDEMNDFGDANTGDSCGMFLNDGYPHIVILGTHDWNWMSTLTHELAHHLLAHLELPLWLDEGLVQCVTRHAGGQGAWLDEDVEPAELRTWCLRHKHEWLRGESFYQPPPIQQYSYWLAEEVTQRILPLDRERIQSFLRTACRVDGGEKAAQEHLGVSIDDLIASVFL